MVNVLEILPLEKIEMYIAKNTPSCVHDLNEFFLKVSN